MPRVDGLKGSKGTLNVQSPLVRLKVSSVGRNPSAGAAPSGHFTAQGKFAVSSDQRARLVHPRSFHATAPHQAVYAACARNRHVFVGDRGRPVADGRYRQGDQRSGGRADESREHCQQSGLHRVPSRQRPVRVDEERLCGQRLLLAERLPGARCRRERDHRVRSGRCFARCAIPGVEPQRQRAIADFARCW